MLSINEITVYYSQHRAIYDLKLRVASGSLTLLLGPNGAGKTTLLKTIIGLIKPSRGDIMLHGVSILNRSPYERVKMGLSLVPEGRKLFPYMTVKENIELGCYLMKKNEFNYRFVFELFPILKEREKQLAVTLSGGEQQMLAIARALASNPKILMLDEPFLGLAPKIINKIVKILHELKESGLTIVIAEQRLVRELLRIADIAHIINNGSIVETLEDPSSLVNRDVWKVFTGEEI